VQRCSAHREYEAAAHVLKRQDVYADHRPIQRDDIQHEYGCQHVERPGPAAGAGRQRVTAADRHRMAIGGGERMVGHCVSSLRMSTVRRIATTSSETITVRMVALAAAVGYWQHADVLIEGANTEAEPPPESP